MDGLSCPTDGLVGDYADIVAKNITLRSGDQTVTIGVDSDMFSLDTSKYYTKTEIDSLLSQATDNVDNKADKATTLAGYGITDAYTKAEVGNLLSSKANSSSVYTKTQVNNLLSDKVNSSDVYNKTDINNMIQNVGQAYEIITTAQIDAIIAGE